MTRSYHLFQLGVFLLILTACSAGDPALNPDVFPNSGTATLSWDPNAGTDIVGYKIYIATASGAYETPIATTSIDVTTYTIAGLTPGTTYFFVVTAFDTDGTESPFSNEASTVIP
ncbi:MAG TPA: fibronectin type III domain-containing protein [Nitrospira sp.]|nr:fibronectin type III domain-containing protein [Nitrospira sp.]